MKAIIFLVGMAFLIIGCGVKGDPVAPTTPPEISRGRPDYKKAFRNVKVNSYDQKVKDDEGDEQEE